MFLVSTGGEPVAAALITAPYNLIVADTEDEAAIEALIAGIKTDELEVPGVTGNRPTIERFVAKWDSEAPVAARLLMAQGVFALEQVASIEPTSGSARIAVHEDLELIESWTWDFMMEALPDEPRMAERMRDAIKRLLDQETPGAHWLWSHGGQPVSLSTHKAPTGHGIRIGPVYTPPEHRRNGYASSLVAAQSQWLLDNGYDFCFLYTDLANPTSNAIYERIGYRQVAEAAMYGFESDG
jgi:hypothetical protein